MCKTCIATGKIEIRKIYCSECSYNSPTAGSHQSLDCNAHTALPYFRNYGKRRVHKTRVGYFLKTHRCTTICPRFPRAGWFRVWAKSNTKRQEDLFLFTCWHQIHEGHNFRRPASTLGSLRTPICERGETEQIQCVLTGRNMSWQWWYTDFRGSLKLDRTTHLIVSTISEASSRPSWSSKKAQDGVIRIKDRQSRQTELMATRRQGKVGEKGCQQKPTVL